MTAANPALAVTGASGRLGGLVLARIAELAGPAAVVALTRNPGAVTVPHVRARHADFADPTTLPAALDGVRRLLVVSTDRSPGRLRLHAAVITAAATAGVEHLVYTSVVRAGEPGNPVAEAADHGATERLLADSGVAHTVLRFNVWSEMLTYSRLAHRAVATGSLPSSAGDGRTGFVSRGDTARAAAAVLAADGPVDLTGATGPTGLTGPTALTGLVEGGDRPPVLNVTGPGVTDAEVAAALTEATGRRVRHHPVADDEVPRALTALGLAEPVARGWGENDPARRAGWFDVPVDGLTHRLLGRAPTSLAAFFAGHRAELLAG
ncbi:NAD(P)H-binding protein [Kitasatospora sp. NBC_01560]|uniref:NAD(P)H-binding protein n=1 Tax=Kitasatospora sp. NBC_01560 TaxID=2975965 RepID=UPI003862D6DD